MNYVTRFNLDELVRNHGSSDVERLVIKLPDYTGRSYILDYRKLLKTVKTMKCSGDYLIDYIVLASYRDYNIYKSTGDNTLSAALCPLSDRQIIKNPFINRYGKKIVFLLEPSPAGHYL